jgi:DNA processing protein
VSRTECTEDEACAAALAWLGTSPARLRRLLIGYRARQAWEAVVAGDHPEDPAGRARALADPALPEQLARRCEASGISVRVLGSAGYPPCLARDVQAPAVVFVEGNIEALEAARRVALVGTRSATATGRLVAQDMARALAERSVAVISGLAEGIDMAALAGALEAGAGAGAVAVLGTAHDAPGTSAQRRLCRSLAEHGVVLSELPPGAASARWRFAVRNRIMAALAHVVVVAECHSAGGALHTVRAARRRGIPVAVVPGSVNSPASEGTNALLVTGAHCVRHGADVIDLLARLTRWRPEPPAAGEPVENRGDAAGLDPITAAVLGALEHDPVGLDALVLRTGASLAVVSLALERLVAGGLAVGEAGFWSRAGISRRRRP